MKLFGQYLVEKGHVTQRQLLECLIEQSNLMHSVPKVCLEHSLLEDKDIFDILRQQAYSKKDFVTIATDMGLWTDEKQKKLEEESQKSRPLIGELLLSKGYLQAEKMSNILAEFFQAYEAEKELLNRKIQDLITKELSSNQTDFLNIREIMSLADLAGDADLNFILVEFIFKHESNDDLAAREKDKQTMLAPYLQKSAA